MKKILDNIRSRPPEFRMMVAVILAVVATGLVGGLWVWTLAATRAPKSDSNAPSPFTAITQTIKASIANSPAGERMNGATGGQAEIIDAGVEEAMVGEEEMFDETNPAGDNSGTTF